MLIIVNGRGWGCGKDTVVEAACKRLQAEGHTTAVKSSVQVVKRAAVLLGWNGDKTPEDRKALGELKAIADRHWDHSFKLAHEVADTSDFVFMDVRETEKIARLRAELGPRCLYLYVDYAANLEAQARRQAQAALVAASADSDVDSFNTTSRQADVVFHNDYRGTESTVFVSEVERLAGLLLGALARANLSAVPA